MADIDTSHCQSESCCILEKYSDEPTHLGSGPISDRSHRPGRTDKISRFTKMISGLSAGQLSFFCPASILNLSDKSGYDNSLCMQTSAKTKLQDDLALFFTKTIWSPERNYAAIVTNANEATLAKLSQHVNSIHLKIFPPDTLWDTRSPGCTSGASCMPYRFRLIHHARSNFSKPTLP
jgi:hypothetical protein